VHNGLSPSVLVASSVNKTAETAPQHALVQIKEHKLSPLSLQISAQVVASTGVSFFFFFFCQYYGLNPRAQMWYLLSHAPSQVFLFVCLFLFLFFSSGA
jgi:hypothetical protein